MALTNVKLVDKEELTLPANEADYIYIRRNVAGGGFSEGDYKITVQNLIGNALPFASVGEISDIVEGSMYFDTTTKKLRVYNGSGWDDLN